MISKSVRLFLFILAGTVFGGLNGMVAQGADDLTGVISRLEALDLEGGSDIIVSLKSIAQAMKGSGQEIGLVTVQDIERVKGAALRFLSSTRYTTWSELQEKIHALDLAVKDFRVKYNDKLTGALQKDDAQNDQPSTPAIGDVEKEADSSAADISKAKEDENEGGEDGDEDDVAIEEELETELEEIDVTLGGSESKADSVTDNAGGGQAKLDLSAEVEATPALDSSIEAMETAALPTSVGDTLTVPEVKASVEVSAETVVTPAAASAVVAQEATVPVVSEISAVPISTDIPAMPTAAIEPAPVVSDSPAAAIAVVTPTPIATSVQEITPEPAVAPAVGVESAPGGASGISANEGLDEQEGLGSPDMSEGDSI